MGRHLQKQNVTLFPMLLVELSMTCLILLGSRCPFSFQISCCVAMDTQLLRKTRGLVGLKAKTKQVFFFVPNIHKHK